MVLGHFAVLALNYFYLFHLKKFPVFSNKIKTKAHTQNLRQSFLQGNVFDISEKFQYQIYNIKREILGQKIKVEKIDKKKSTFLKMLNISNI